MIHTEGCLDERTRWS